MLTNNSTVLTKLSNVMRCRPQRCVTLYQRRRPHFPSTFPSYHIQHTRQYPHSSCHLSLVVSSNMTTPSGEKLADLCFDPCEATNGNKSCQVHKKMVKQGPGYTNLYANVNKCHEHYIAVRRDLRNEKSKMIFENFYYPRNVVSGHRWLELFILNLKPFAFVSKIVTRVL